MVLLSGRYHVSPEKRLREGKTNELVGIVQNSSQDKTRERERAVL